VGCNRRWSDFSYIPHFWHHPTGEIMSPSDIAWWGWILISIGCGVVSFYAFGLAARWKSKPDEETRAYSKGAGEWGFIFAVASFISFAIGIIRFVKWVWAG
jgi:hypothetical protein